EDVDDVSVPDLIDGTRFRDEPRHHVGIGGEFALQDLDRGGLPDDRVYRPIDDAEAPLSDQAFYPIFPHYLAGQQISVHAHEGRIRDERPSIHLAILFSVRVLPAALGANGHSLLVPQYFGPGGAATSR